MDAPLQVAVFDAYGTLFDVHAAARSVHEEIGPESDRLSLIWRTKQLEYTWLRTLMRRHADFWQVTCDALDHALAAVGHAEDEALRTRLLELYREIPCYAEVPSTLSRLRERGVRTAILSNGSPQMLTDAVRSAGLAELLDDVLSVEPLKVFKPSPHVYRLPGIRFGVPDHQIAFMTSNAWDAAGASSAGLRVVWVNRFGHTPEVLPAGPDHEIPNLANLPSLLLG